MLQGAVYYAWRFDGYSEAKLEDFSKVSHHFSIHNNIIHCLVNVVVRVVGADLCRLLF
jgi:hypothetical protein